MDLPNQTDTQQGPEGDRDNRVPLGLPFFELYEDPVNDP
jgi:hypothetical protein